MRRLLFWLLVLVALAVLGPPLYYSVAGPEPPRMPDPGRAVELADGTRINVLDQGQGPAIVLSHGLPGSAYDWTPLPETLARAGRRVISYDRKGWGHSDRRSEGEAFTIDANARELVALLEALDLRDATVVGWSYGAAALTRAAELDPSRMSHVVLLGAGPPPEGDGPPPWLISLIYSRPGRAWLARVPPVSIGLATAISRQAFSDQAMPDWWVPQVRANLSLPGTRHTQASETREFDLEEFRPAKIQRPVLVILGREDRLVSAELSERWYREQLPSAEFLVVDGASHMLPITHADPVAERIVGFSGS